MNIDSSDGEGEVRIMKRIKKLYENERFDCSLRERICILILVFTSYVLISGIGLSLYNIVSNKDIDKVFCASNIFFTILFTLFFILSLYCLIKNIKMMKNLKIVIALFEIEKKDEEIDLTISEENKAEIKVCNIIKDITITRITFMIFMCIGIVTSLILHYIYLNEIWDELIKFIFVFFVLSLAGSIFNTIRFKYIII